MDLQIPQVEWIQTDALQPQVYENGGDDDGVQLRKDDNNVYENNDVFLLSFWLALIELIMQQQLEKKTNFPIFWSPIMVFLYKLKIYKKVSISFMNNLGSYVDQHG